MKKYILIALVALTAVCCTEEKIKTYSGGHYLSFLLNGQTDSTVTSFFFYPGEEELAVPVVLTLGGGPLSEDASYELEVVADKSNALSKNYKLTPYTFRKGLVQDTAYITLLKSDELDTQEYRLVLQVKPGGMFELGQTEFRTSKIVFSAKASQPEWWDATVRSAYLGDFSEAKYQHFIIATDGEGAYFGEKEADEKRALALQFLYYLRDAKDSGSPIMDGNVEMTIPVVG